MEAAKPNPTANRSGVNMFYINCFLAVLAGTLIPLQAGINSKLREYLSSPYYATLISVTVSLIAVGLFCLIARLPLPAQTTITSAPAWAWTGGIVGVIYIFMVLLLAHKLGATALIAGIIGGQMICSLILDQFGLIGFAQHPLNPGRIVGIVLLIAGVALIQKY
ncbi:MAG TPA: DMT family transporter [Candidatus Melainabacteria bacterium]|jgi:bacterial/archaeal transporter family-2 protein|nr:DMT family transporter [Candidatus Melainabacteria bacterium]HIN63132.1 DMT family transporter [Candidatus Obscuribacterales bacterium]